MIYTLHWADWLDEDVHIFHIWTYKTLKEAKQALENIIQQELSEWQREVYKFGDNTTQVKDKVHDYQSIFKITSIDTYTLWYKRKDGFTNHKI